MVGGAGMWRGWGGFDGMHGDVKTFQMKGASEELVSALAARLKGPRRLLSAGSGGWGDGVDAGGRGGGGGQERRGFASDS